MTIKIMNCKRCGHEWASKKPDKIKVCPKCKKSVFQHGSEERRGIMGNAVFIVLHLMAVLFGFVFLFITIPAHLIYCMMAGKKR